MIASTKVRVWFLRSRRAVRLTKMQHFIANEQEGNRKPWAETQSISSNIDDKTMHELYLWYGPGQVINHTESR